MFSFLRRNPLFIACDIGTSSLNLVAFRFARGERAAELILRRSQKIKDPSSDISLFSGVLLELKNFIREAELKGGLRALRVQLVLPYGLTHLEQNTFRFLRPRSSAFVSAGEMSELLRTLEDQASHLHRAEDGVENDEILLSLDVTEVKADGYPVTTSLPSRGGEISIGALSSFWSRAWHDRLKNEFAGTDHSRFVISPRLAQVCRYFKLHLGAAAEGICLDIGAEHTGMLFVSQGALEDFRTFPLGGADITREIAVTLHMSYEDAETMKRQWAAGELVASAGARVAQAAHRAIEYWLGEWGAALQKIAERRVIHPTFFLTGGGALIPSLPGMLASKNWLKQFALPEEGHETATLIHPFGKELRYFPGWSFSSPADSVLFATVSRIIEEEMIH